MSEKRKFFRASSDYFGAQLFGLLASFVSFPIIVRIFSVEDYGVLSLCNTILLFGVAFSKLGMQNAAVRFYPEYDCRNDLPVFFRTFALTGALAGLVFLVLAIPFSWWILPSGYTLVLLPLAFVIFLQTVNSYFVNFLRSGEKTRLQAGLTVLTRVGGVFGGIALVLWLGQGIEGLYLGQSIFLLLSIGGLILLYRRYLSQSGRAFDPELLAKGLRFGLPLMVFELSSIVLAFSDRFLITYYNGPAALGVYAAGYAICMYLADLIRQPLAMAVVPMYTRLYVRDGKAAASEFVSNLIGIVALIVFPIFAGFMAIHQDLLLALASEKYLLAAQIMPWVAGSLLIYSLQPLLAAGLYLGKSTALIARVSLFCGLLNIVINVVALPRVGIVGAAWATAASYILALILMARASARTFSIAWPFKKIIPYGICSGLLYFLVTFLPESTPLPLKVLAGALGYPGMVLLIDRELRQQFATLTQRCRS